jgi:hypothetical protein
LHPRDFRRRTSGRFSEEQLRSVASARRHKQRLEMAPDSVPVRVFGHRDVPPSYRTTSKFCILSACPKFRPFNRKLIVQQQGRANMAAISGQLLWGFCMLGAVEQVHNPATINPRLLPAIDQLLIAGIKLGPNKKHEAINKILKLVPEWKRGDCWRRIRQLRRTPALASHIRQELKQTDENSLSHRGPARPWLPEDDAKLLDLAGYEPVNEIAERLGRSERAVRFRLGALGMSARVTDGWSQRSLRKLLRMSRTRLRQLVADGMLRVRDPRITRTSLASCCAKRQSLDSSSASANTPLPGLPGRPCSWKRAAKALDAEVGAVQKMISDGQLKLVDTFVTDRAFEEFCRKNGSLINMA